MAELVLDGFTARPVLHEEADHVWASTRSDSTESQGIPTEEFFARFLDGFAFGRGEWAVFWFCKNLTSWEI